MWMEKLASVQDTSGTFHLSCPKRILKQQRACFLYSHSYHSLVIGLCRCRLVVSGVKATRIMSVYIVKSRTNGVIKLTSFSRFSKFPFKSSCLWFINQYLRYVLMMSDWMCWWSCYGNPLTRHGHVTAKHGHFPPRQEAQTRANETQL